MDIFSILSLVGGLAFFLFGMHAMSSSLEKLAGGRLEQSLKKVTSKPLLSLLLGMILTIAMQSSSATTVMLVGLVGSGIMMFEQTIYVILGANIGTTLTAWILSLSGLDSSSVWIQMLKPVNFSPIAAIIGIILLMVTKSSKKRIIGTALVGFALLMYGMTMMSDAVSPLAESSSFSSVMESLSNPILGLLLALVFTAVVQSSAASIGVLQALSLTGSISIGTMIPMIMGLNIGTCATSLISCIGTNTNAKRVAVTHLSIKVFGTVLCLPVYLILNSMGLLSFTDNVASTWGIALIHTVYNLILTVIFLPLGKLLVSLIAKLLKDKTKEKELFILPDERLLQVSSVAIVECRIKTADMCSIAGKNLKDSFRILFDYDPKTAGSILKNEDLLDLMEDKLGNYLVPVAAKSIAEEDSKKIAVMLRSIGDFERLGDHAANLLKTAREIHEKKIVFSDQAKAELKTIFSAMTEILEITESAYREEDLRLASRVEPLEQVIDGLTATVKKNHIDRLVTGTCTIEHGFVLSDILGNLERVSDHCSNIAIALIEQNQPRLESHSYLNALKYGEDEFFRREYSDFSAKYKI